MLQLSDVCFSYSKTRILDGINFSLNPKEIASLIGVSGSGKTTLFKLITGVLSPLAGEIKTEEGITYMQQQDLLLPWRSVLGNLLLFSELGAKRAQKQALKGQALHLLECVGLKDCAHLYPHHLSGGMRQRVALARSLLQDKPLLLLDEPFGSLDVIVREELYGLLKQIRDRSGKTILLVTHDFRDALALSDRIFVLRAGKVVEVEICEEKIKEALILPSTSALPSR